MNLENKLIKESIISNIIGDKTIEVLNLNVDVLNGFVRLTGRVPDQLSREKILKKSMEVDGVISIRNRLRVEKQSFKKK